MAFGVSVLVLYNGYKIIRTSLAGIMDEADIGLLQELVAVLNNSRRENWIDLHNFRVIKFGRMLHVDCHLTVPWYLNVKEAHKEIDELGAIIKNEFDSSMEIFVHTDGCMEFSCGICTKKDCTVRMQPFKQRIEWTLDIIVRNQKHGATI
jgi:divalent metal cation (Fe/Co/Zn/Cd) transporter